MLRISLDVQSGTSYMVVPKKSKGSYLDKFNLRHNPDNRHLFLKGLLLALMGERISLYALERLEENHEWEESVGKLELFLSKIELKGNLNEQRSNFHLGLFEQHRKHDAVKYANYIVDNGEIKETDENTSRLNAKYSPYIEAGLFDMFVVNMSVFKSKFLIKNSKLTLASLTEAISFTLKNNLNFDGDYINATGISVFQDQLKGIFVTDVELELPLCDGDNIYGSIMDLLEDNDAISKSLNKKKSLFKKLDRTEDEEVSLRKIFNIADDRMIIFGYFALRYLTMYGDLLASNKGKVKPNCSSFGIKSLDFKKKSMLVSFQTWLLDYSKPLKESSSVNGNSEYFKTVFNAPKYNVSKSAPTLSKRYDGTFELFIKTDRETEAFIKDKIVQSNCWITRVGKLSLGRLQGLPDIIPNSYWDKITDDVVNVEAI